MIKKDVLKKVLDLLQLQQEKDNKFAKSMEQVLNGNFVPNMHEHIFESFMLLYSHAVENIDNPNDTFLDWYIFETNFGEKPKECSFNGKTYTIDSFDSFFDMLVEYHKQNPKKYD